MCRPQNASFPRSKFVQAGRIPEWWHEPSAYPPIRLILAQGDEDVTIKISDEGGGIPRSGMPLVWTYSYTTCNDPNGNGTSGTNGVSGSSLFDPSPSRGKDTAKIAGYGFGLPLSRITARYFGGDLVLMPLEGYGMDAYLHLRRLADNQEWLP
jgi:pyruvate dehydrogenase kinase 2/3/4